MRLVALFPPNCTTTVASPIALAVTTPLKSTVTTVVFVLDQNGEGSGGTGPGPISTDIERCRLLPTLT
jgi:hypothetical protein